MLREKITHQGTPPLATPSFPAAAAASVVPLSANYAARLAFNNHRTVGGIRGAGFLLNLNLAHSWAALHTWTSVGASARAEAGEHGGGQEGQEAKPEEGGRGLGFAAFLLGAAGGVVAEVVGLREEKVVRIFLFTRYGVLRKCLVRTALLQLCTCKYAAVAIPPMNQNRVKSE